MHDGLHLVAVGLTAIAACVHPGRRRAADLLGFGCALLMLVAMVDAIYLHLLALPLWSAVLLAAALALAALRSPRRRRAHVNTAGACTVLHDGLGLVGMAALLPLMQGADVAGSHHGGHGVGIGVLLAVALAVAGGHVAASVVAFTRRTRSRGDVRDLLMGGATLLMAGAAIV